MKSVLDKLPEIGLQLMILGSSGSALIGFFSTGSFDGSLGYIALAVICSIAWTVLFDKKLKR
jgi:hypothetical protein